MTVTETAVTIFFTFNAIGNIPLFLAVLRGYSHKRQVFITFREVFAALILMILFSYCGKQILSALDVSISEVRIGGGVILFMLALAMIFPKSQKATSSIDEEPFIVPLAIPVLTGPGTITTVMLYAHAEPNPWYLLAAVVLAWVPSCILLMSASYLQKWLGEKVLLALERLMGMILTLISMQMLGRGFKEFATRF